MRKVFDVELGAESGRFAALTLPAAPWSMQDALEKLCLKEGELPSWEVLETHSCDRIYPYLNQENTLFELNALCQQLSLLDERQTTIVEGLIKADFDQGARPVPMQRMIDMAYSTDRCHFLDGITTDAQLGRFAAENGFVPEADDLPDEAFELLDFTKLGREFRQTGGGVFTSGGYVQRHDELRQASKYMDFTPIKPDYTIMAETYSGCEVKFPFPANEPMWTERVRCVDCMAPGLIGASGGMERIDLLARRLSGMEEAGTLAKYKALLIATGCDDVECALDLVDELDQYSLSPALREPDEVAKARLEQFLPDDVRETLLPHVQLYAFGKALVEAQGNEITEYGLIERTDSSPIRAEYQRPIQGGMEMK